MGINLIDSDKILHIGKILVCEKKLEFGILVGYYDDYRSIKGPVLLSFNKQIGEVYPKECLAYYIVKSENDNLVSVLGLVDEVPYVTGGEFQIRSDKRYHTDTEWEFITKGTAFVRDICGYFPKDISNDRKDMYFYKFGPLTQIVYKQYIYIKSNCEKQNVAPHILARKIEEITEYVDSLNIQDILNTYIVGSWGMYKRIPGKDNYYCYGSYKRIDTDDQYIRSLLPLEDNTDYYNTDIQGDEEQDFQKSDEQEANKNRDIAKQKYSKADHIAYYINEFYDEIKQLSLGIRQKKILLKYIFYTPIGVCNFSMQEYKQHIKEYNEGGYKRHPLFLNKDFIELLSKYDADNDSWMWG